MSLKEMTMKEAKVFLADHPCCQQCLKQTQATCNEISRQGGKTQVEAYKASRPDCIKALLKAYEPIVVENTQEEEHDSN